MKVIKFKLKGFKLFFAAFAFIAAAVCVLYIFLLPFLFSNKTVINSVSKLIKNSTGINVQINSPVLKTSLSPKIYIAFKEISADFNGNPILELKDFKTAFSFDPLFKKELKFKKLGIDSLYFNADNLFSAIPPGSDNKKETDGKLPFKINIFSSLFYINECEIISSISNGAQLNLRGRKILIEENRNPKHLRFIFDAVIKNNSRTLSFKFSDNNKFYIKDRTLIIDDCPLEINNSKILIESLSNESSFAVMLKSRNFNINDGAELLALNIFLNNGSDIINELNDIKGSSDFYIRADNKGLRGGIRVNPSSFKLKSLSNLPVYVNGGKIKITPTDVTLKDFSGYYGSSKENKIKLEGSVADYYKSVDTKITVSTVMTDDLTRNYVSKLIGASLTMTGDKPAGARIEIYSKNNDMDIIYMAKLESGNDILIEGTALGPKTYDRAIKCDMHLIKNILNIESIKYYIAKTINKESKIEPILTLHGDIDILDNSKILNFGFNIPKPLPSEFLNIFVGQKLFKKGTISGELVWLNRGKVPKLKGNLAADKVIVPSQRLFIKEGRFSTDRERLKFSANGFFRRSKYELSGDISNSVLFPIVVNNVNFTLDNIDLEKLLEPQTLPVNSAESQNEDNFVKAVESGNVEAQDTGAAAFIPGIIKIKEGTFNLNKGSYKDIEFGNLKAVMSLDEFGNLNIESNKFDFAGGHSSGKIKCNLAENTFRAVLGAKEIDSDKIASALLNLKREITGLASGIIDINLDSSLKLNGKMKFNIKNGTIQKIGLVEYALNFVSIFRNPMAMISPSIIFDIANIPEGNFDKIWGDISIKDNVVDRMMIKSTAAQLATLIMGRYDLETSDASLRIYTKFTNKNKGAAGFLRSLSLNSLANRGNFGTNSALNYYSAELSLIPELSADEKDCQVFLTTVDGDVEHNNFLSALKKIK